MKQCAPAFILLFGFIGTLHAQVMPAIANGSENLRYNLKADDITSTLLKRASRRPAWMSGMSTADKASDVSSFVQATLTFERWDTSNNGWKPSLVDTNYYDGSGRLTQSIRRGWTGLAWQLFTKTLYSYDGNGRQTDSLVQYWTDSTWRNMTEKYSTYDGSGRLIHELTYSWNGVSSWDTSLQSTLTYDGSGRVATRLVEVANPLYGPGYGLDTFTYDDTARSVVIRSQRWDRTALVWTNYFQRTSSYDGVGNPTLIVEEFWNDSVWANVNQYSYTYDGGGELTTRHTQHWNDSTWAIFRLDSASYDSTGKIRAVLYLGWNGVTWVNIYVDSSYYDVNGNLVTFLGRVWSAGTWVGDQKYTYSWIATATVAHEIPSAGHSFGLSENYPNPFNPETRLSYSVGRASSVVLSIYDVLGREVATLVNEHKQPGEYSVSWIAEGVPSGVYFYRLIAGDFVATKKMVVMR